MEEHCGNSVVSVLLSESNYKAWSVQVKYYLLARNLWDVVVKSKGTRLPKGDAQILFKRKAWKQKNAAALHAILISCSPSILPVIEEIKSARIAWAALADKYGHVKSEAKNETNGSVSEAEINEGNVNPNETNGSVSKAEINESNVNPNEGVEFQKYELLFKAVYDGDLDTAKQFLVEHPEGVRVKAPGFGKTALQVAVTAEHLHIVSELVKLMTDQEVEIVRDDGFTALAAAIEVGNLPIAKCLIKKNKRLITINQKSYGIPVEQAAVSGQKHMVHYLYSVTPADDLIDQGMHAATVLSQFIWVQCFDVALDFLAHAPTLAITENILGDYPLFILALSKAFPSGCSLKFWQQWIYSCIHIPDSAINHISLDIDIDDSQKYKKINMSVLLGPLRWGCSYILELFDIKGIYETKLLNAQSLELLRRMCMVIEDTSDQTKIDGIHDTLIAAVYAGNVEFIIGMVKANPSLIWNPYIARRVFEVAVKVRQAKIFSLIYGLPNKIALVSCSENKSNMLHKAAAIAPPRVLKLIPGAALQMQRELQWFKAVEALASPATRESLNKDDLRPRALFTENHKDLVVEGEKWMKDTASSSTVVGALIVTVTFAAAFTFPGGNDQNSGYPFFLADKLFKVFMMSNAVALFTSTTSVLMFLGILTSRYGEEDFLKSLPKKLIIGLSTLFLSIAAMIIAFVAGISLMFHRRLWIVVPSVCLACIPISFFVLMQFPLLVDIFMSTYGPSIFDTKKKRWI